MSGGAVTLFDCVVLTLCLINPYIALNILLLSFFLMNEYSECNKLFFTVVSHFYQTNVGQNIMQKAFT